LWLTPLEVAQKAAEEFMHKEVKMLYKISLLEKDDAEFSSQWFITHSRYQRLQNFKLEFENIH
jgi:uncharacterized protein YqgQ